MPNTDKNAEQLELSYIARGNAKWYRHSGTWFGRFYERTCTNCSTSM